MRVIIVDDDEMVVKFLEIYLTKHGFEIVGKAYDGKSAIELAKEVEFDGIVIDYYLPDILGYDVATQISKIKEKAKIIVITASPDVKEDGFTLIIKGDKGFKRLVKELKGANKVK